MRQRHIFENNLESNVVRNLFSVDAQERLDQKDLVSAKLFFSPYLLYSLVF